MTKWIGEVRAERHHQIVTVDIDGDMHYHEDYSYSFNVQFCHGGTRLGVMSFYVEDEDIASVIDTIIKIQDQYGL